MEPGTHRRHHIRKSLQLKLQPVSLASALKLCQAAVSLSKGLTTVTVPLLGSILKALVASLLLSMEYLTRRKQRKHFYNRGEINYANFNFQQSDIDPEARKLWRTDSAIPFVFLLFAIAAISMLSRREPSSFRNRKNNRVSAAQVCRILQVFVKEILSEILSFTLAN